MYQYDSGTEALLSETVWKGPKVLHSNFFLTLEQQFYPYRTEKSWILFLSGFSKAKTELC